VFRQCLLTKLLFIKMLVILELIRAYTENNWNMLVVLRETERSSEVLWTLRALVVGYREAFSPI